MTFCTHQRQCLFGQVIDGVMELNDLGQIVAEEWLRSATLRQEIELDAWVIMFMALFGSPLKLINLWWGRTIVRPCQIFPCPPIIPYLP